MQGRIPDFGRGTADSLKQAAARYFKTKPGLSLHLASDLDPYDLTDALDTSSAPTGGPKKWTVLFYLDGNNTLYGPAYEAMKNLEKVGSNQDVNLVVELGANPGDKSKGGLTQALMDAAMHDKKLETVRRYLVTKDASDSDKITSPKLQDLGKADMGDPKTVSDFIKWGIQNYPAEHYAVVLFNHGAGFAGVLSDENTGSLLSTNDLKQVVNDAAQEAGKKLDLVDFDACLMAQAEVAHAIQGGAKYMVASEETERGMAQPLEQVMKDLKEGSKQQAMDPADLARLFVYEAFHQPEGDLLTSTLSALDLQKMPAVAAAADGLAQAVIANPGEAGAVRKDVKQSENFCRGLDYKLYNDFHDLGHFAQILKGDPKVDDATRKAAGSVLDAVNNAVVAEEHSGKLYAKASGISTYLPTNYGHDPRPHTDSVNFAKNQDYENTTYSHDTHWADMLKGLSKDTAWHNLLHDAGLSKDHIDALDHKLHVVGGAAAGLTHMMLNVGNLGARWEALEAVKNGVPGNFFLLGSTAALSLGALGGGYEIFHGVRDLYNTFQDKAPSGISDLLLDTHTRRVNAGMTIATGAALTAVNAGLLLGLSAGITTTAGVLALAIPAAKLIYDAVHVTHNLREKAEQMQHPQHPVQTPVADKLQDVAANNGHLVR